MSRLIIAALAAFFTLTASAQEKIIPTDVGYIAITDQPCTFKNLDPKHNLEWHAYATEAGQPDHIGCWKMPDAATIQIYWPELQASGVYKITLFKDPVKGEF